MLNSGSICPLPAADLSLIPTTCHGKRQRGALNKIHQRAPPALSSVDLFCCWSAPGEFLPIAVGSQGHPGRSWWVDGECRSSAHFPVTSLFAEKGPWRLCCSAVPSSASGISHLVFCLLPKKLFQLSSCWADVHKACGESSCVEVSRFTLGRALTQLFCKQTK